MLFSLENWCDANSLTGVGWLPKIFLGRNKFDFEDSYDMTSLANLLGMSTGAYYMLHGEHIQAQWISEL